MNGMLRSFASNGIATRERERERDAKRSEGNGGAMKFPSLGARKTSKLPVASVKESFLPAPWFQEVRLEFRLRGAPTRIWNASVVGLASDSLPWRFSGTRLRAYVRDCVRPRTSARSLGPGAFDRVRSDTRAECASRGCCSGAWNARQKERRKSKRRVSLLESHSRATTPAPRLPRDLEIPGDAATPPVHWVSRSPARAEMSETRARSETIKRERVRSCVD